MWTDVPHDVVSVEVTSQAGKEIRFTVNGGKATGKAYTKRQRNVENIGKRQGGGVRSYRRQF